MALTKKLMLENASLKDLSDAQIDAVIALSANDESVVLGAKIAELHNRYDADVKSIAGVEKEASEKSYDYIKRILSDLKEKSSGATETASKLAEYESEIAALKTKVAEGKGNEVLAQQLKDAEAKAEALQTQYSADKEKWQQTESEFKASILQSKVDSVFDSAVGVLTFKKEYPEAIRNTLIDAAKNRLLFMHKPDFIEVDGEKKLIFRDKDGEIVRNSNNALNPFSAKELMTRELKDILSNDSGAGGAGTKGSGAGGGTKTVDIGQAKTQVEADEIISNTLMKSGEVRGAESFAAKQAEIRLENKVADLPMR